MATIVSEIGCKYTLECLKQVIALEDCIVFASMPGKFRNNTHQALVGTFRTFSTVWGLKSAMYLKDVPGKSLHVSEWS
jgi:hypothetical protein